MQPTDKTAFGVILTGCLQELYDKPVSPALLNLWFACLQPYPLAEVQRAFERHLVNPDAGQFPPKPADIVRLIDGSGDGQALLAWAKAERAVRTVGGYRSVAFDDPLIHVVIADMGGWIRLCETKTDELPFRQQEFAKRYRALLLSVLPDYPAHLCGRAELANRGGGLAVEPPLLIGDPDRAMRVMLNGAEATAPALAWPPVNLATRKLTTRVPVAAQPQPQAEAA